MAGQYNEEQKQKIYEWREKNQDRYKEIQKKAVKKYQDKTKEHMKQKKREWYLRKKKSLSKID